MGKLKAETKRTGRATPAESARFGVCGWLRHESNLAFLDGLAKLGREAEKELKRRNLNPETAEK